MTVSQMDVEPKLTTEIDFLLGGGEMGALIRQYPWADSSLGNPSGWPTPLRIMVRLLLTTNHPMFVFWGPEFICLYNDAFSRSQGPEKHPQMLGARGRIVWAEIWHLIGEQIDHVMSAKGATWQENQLVPITRHGRKEDVYWTYGYSPIDDPAAPLGVGGVLVVCTETTQQVLNASRLREAEARWRELFEQAPGFMCSLSGPEHIFEFCNPAYFALIDRDDVIGKRLIDALPWASEQGFIDILDRVYSLGESFVATGARMAVPGRHGSVEVIRYVDFVYQPIVGDNEQVKGIFVLGSDVTERVVANQALRKSEERLRIACDAAELGIHDFDVASGVVSWDERARAFWGVDPDETVTYKVFAAGLHVDDREPTRLQLLKSIDPDGDRRYIAEYRVIHRHTGTLRWLLATGHVSFDGRIPLRLVGTVIDITDRKMAEVRRYEFLATLGHELRNPLAPISNCLQLLKRLPNIDEAAKAAHAVIERQLTHLVRLLEDLLDVVRIRNGRIALRRSVVPLAEVMQMSLETASAHIEAGEFQAKLQLPPASVCVDADPIRLAQVFSNLLINACKYSEVGSAIECTAQFDPASNSICVCIRDFGIGIEAEYLHRVFDMFSQAEPSIQRSQGGLGIGLSLARDVIQLHGGSIVASSEGSGQGSEFRVYLPVCEA